MTDLQEKRPSGETEAKVETPVELIRAVGEALEKGDVVAAAELALSLHVADQADLLEQLGRERRAELIEQIKPALDPELLTHLDEHVRAEVIELLGPAQAAAAIAQLDTDDAIEVLEDLEEPDQIALLETLPLPERTAVEEGLTFPEDSAGRLMQRELVAAPEFWTVGQTIDYLRANPKLPDDFYDIYIINPRFEPVGSIPLSKVLRSKRGVLLTELKLKELHRIPATMDQEEVGFQFRQYGLVSAPVVNEAGRLLGVITVDDVVHVIEEEAEEDILRLGGVPDAGLFAPPLQTSLRRAPWLLLNLGTAMLAALVIAQFEAAIERLVVLAVLMPVVVALGGNAAMQAVTVTVRALAMRQITRANAVRVLGKELLVGGLNGVALLLAAVLLVIGWFGDIGLSLVFGGGIILTIMVAALVGVTVPILLERLGIDPAVASSVFVLTVTDVFGFFTFLGLATIYLL